MVLHQNYLTFCTPTFALFQFIEMVYSITTFELNSSIDNFFRLLGCATKKLKWIFTT